jgi:hypothetical protein
MRARGHGTSMALLLVMVTACSDLDRLTLPSRLAASALPGPSGEPSTEVLLPGFVGGVSGSGAPISPSPRPPDPSPAVPSPTPTSIVTLPPSLAPTVSPSGPYGGLEAVDLVVEPAVLALGVKTPPALTPVLPDTGVLTATVTLRGGGISSRVVWKSASPGVLSVDENGVCRALDERAQRVQVTATTLDGRLERVVFVELRDRAQVEVILDDTEEP